MIYHKRNEIWSDVPTGLTIHFHTFPPWPIHCNSLMFSWEMNICSESCRTYLDPGPAFEEYKPSCEAELYGPIKIWGKMISGYHYTRAKVNREVLFSHVSMWSWRKQGHSYTHNLNNLTSLVCSCSHCTNDMALLYTV